MANLKTCGPSKLVVLRCDINEDGEQVDADECIAQGRKNMAIANQMMKDAMDAGHIIKDEKGMFKRLCLPTCNCLPQVPGSIRAQHEEDTIPAAVYKPTTTQKSSPAKDAAASVPVATPKASPKASPKVSPLSSKAK